MGELKMYATRDEKVARLAECKAIYEANGPKALIDAVSGWTHHTLFDLLWEGAMSEHYGPVGIHDDWIGPDGTPSAEARELPSVQESIARGKEKIARVFTWVGRDEVPFWR